VISVLALLEESGAYQYWSLCDLSQNEEDRLILPAPVNQRGCPSPTFHRARSTSTAVNVPSKLARFSLQRVAWIGPQLRASNDHRFIVGVP
jgi:hypothetical protein